MAKAECPIEGCEFRDSLKSVEAHISGSTTGEHSGSQGREYRSEIRESIESEDEPAEHQQELEDEGPVEDGDVDLGLGVEKAAPAVAATGLFASGGAEDGFPVGYAALAITVVVVGYYLFKQMSGDSRDETGEERSENGTPQPVGAN